MATKGHKRKRSIEDTPLDLSKMKIAMKHLVSLKEELDGIQETEGEMEAVMEHVQALEKILENAKKPRINFSSFSKADLNNLGLTRKRLVFQPDGIAQLLTRPNSLQHVDGVQVLHTRLAEIYDHVNMDYEAGSRMILDPVLLAVAKLSPKRKSGHDVAIFPEMRLATGQGIFVSHPVSKYEVWLTGNVDYGIIQYPAEHDNRERLLGDDGSRDDAFTLAAGRLFLVEAKRQGEVTNISQHMPKAVSQAVALCEITKKTSVRFCLSNGYSWIFAILEKGQNGERTYYESAARHLNKDVLQTHNESALHLVREMVELIFEWLAPTTFMSPHALYRLMD